MAYFDLGFKGTAEQDVHSLQIFGVRRPSPSAGLEILNTEDVLHVPALGWKPSETAKTEKGKEPTSSVSLSSRFTRKVVALQVGRHSQLGERACNPISREAAPAPWEGHCVVKASLGMLTTPSI
jgi:hypothetical protein